MNEKVTKKEFCELAKCSHQLIDLYVGKGMPKHQHPENKKMNLFDLLEVREWAFLNGFKSFEKKVDSACMAHVELRFETASDQPPHVLPCRSVEIETDPDLEHGEGSTAAPLIVTVDPFLELERRFSALTKQMEVCMSLSRRGK
jgi:hypothetical protein